MTVEETARQHHDPRPEPEPVATACRLVAIADAIAYQVSSAWAKLRESAEQPAWVHRRLETAGAEAAHLASRVSGELARLRAVVPG